MAMFPEGEERKPASLMGRKAIRFQEEQVGKEDSDIHPQHDFTCCPQQGGSRCDGSSLSPAIVVLHRGLRVGT